MIKSIEEQAKEYVESKICFNGLEYSVGGNTYNECFRSFLVGAKARDEQWQAVVNELREALKFYGSDSPSWQRLEHTNSIISDVDLIKPKTVLYKGQLSGGRTADESLTKADQLLKEMGAEL